MPAFWHVLMPHSRGLRPGLKCNQFCMDSREAKPDFSPGNSAFGRERRRATRHTVHSPAYVDLNGSSQKKVLELSEILNISEGGMCIQASAPMKVNRLLPLCIDLSETQSRIYTTGHVAWTEPSGRTGIRFPEMPDSARLPLARWLTVNSRLSETNQAAAALLPPVAASRPVHSRPSSVSAYMSLAVEWAEMQKEVELLGPDLEPALHLIVQRALALTWASGAAIALVNPLTPSEMLCRARAGGDSPELGAILQAGSGFSGECIRTATTLKCDDAETDARVDRVSCRAMGIRSILAAPVQTRTGVIGILEVFSPDVAAFWDNDITVLNRLARMVASSVTRAQISRPPAFAIREPREQPSLFAATLRSYENQELVTRKRSLLRRAILLSIGAAALAGVVWLARPWIIGSVAVSRSLSQSAQAASRNEVYVSADLKELKKAAVKGDAAAQYFLGVHYAVGDVVKQDYRQAMDWFLQSAEHGNIRAQGKMAALLWAGRGAPRDYSRAYFWALLAQAGGDKDAEIFIANCAPHLSHSQIVAEEERADKWLHSHHIGKSSTEPGR